MKKFKNILALSLSVCLVLGGFTGCSNDEITLLNTYKKMMLMDGIKQTGSVSINIDNPESAAYSPYSMMSPFGYSSVMYMLPSFYYPDSTMTEVAKELLNKKINYDVSIIKSKGLAKGSIHVEGANYNLFEFLLKDNEMYLSIDGILKLINDNVALDFTSGDNLGRSVKIEALNKLLGEKKYIAITAESLYEMNSYPIERDWYETYEEYEEASKQEDEYSETEKQTYRDQLSLKEYSENAKLAPIIIDEILLKGFKNFETEAVKTSNGEYSINLNTENSVELLQKTLLYALDHTNDIANGVKTYINNIPYSGYNTYYYETEQEFRQSMLDEADDMLKTVNENKEQYKELIKDMLNPNNVGIISLKARLDGSSYKSGLKDELTSISGTTEMNLNIKTNDFSQHTLKIKANGNFTAQQIDSVEIIAPPKNNVITLSEMVNSESVKPKAMVLNYYDSSYYSSYYNDYWGIQDYGTPKERLEKIYDFPDEPLEAAEPAPVEEAAPATEEAPTEETAEESAVAVAAQENVETVEVEIENTEGAMPVGEDNGDYYYNNENYDEAEIYIYKGLSEDYDYCYYYKQNEKFYVPTSLLEEMFEIKFEWDVEKSQYFVIKGNEKVYFDSAFDTTVIEKFVNAEDMKKLGYQIYENEKDGYTEVVILDR